MLQALAQVLQLSACALDTRPYLSQQCAFHGGQLRQPFGLVGAQHFRGSGGGRSAMVGHQVGDAKIYLVAHGTDDRQHAGGNCPCYLLFIKCPQIFHRATAAPNDQGIEIDFSLGLPAVGALNGRDDLTVSMNGPFAFNSELDDGSEYEVEILSIPERPNGMAYSICLYKLSRVGRGKRNP